MDDINTLRRILKESRIIAVVGLSADWFRPSYFAAKYMQEHGYRVIPVNPKYDSILGEKCYRSLREIPEPVDIVDVFRKTEDVMPIADDSKNVIKVRVKIVLPRGEPAGSFLRPKMSVVVNVYNRPYPWWAHWLGIQV